ncbi:pyrroline-5-carboxylate reductase [Pseudomonas sp. DC3000-4b1]|uniref:pyrroline-5-carboxylate reductase n=1 Tax=unclassified Pseudomonas TaxID=196821 RepID=UPI003CF19552
MNVLFVGYGQMGSAMGKAWHMAGLVQNLYAVDPHLPLDATAQAVPDPEAFDAALDVIVLAVKPAMAGSALASLPKRLLNDCVIISVAAGVTLATLREAIDDACPVVRVMPNTPMLLGAGCTGLYAGNDLPEAKRQVITQLFEAVGSAHWVQREPQLDAVTAISGSGPAYYHLFSEALAAAGEALGLDPELARRLAVDTAFGAATQQRQPQADLVQLRRAITSPNGTTAAAIGVFERDQALRALVQSAARAAAQRAEALSRGE